MRFDFAHNHLSRRDVLRLGATGAAVAAAASVGLPAVAGAEEELAPAGRRGGGGRPQPRYTDEMFDIVRVLTGGFWVSPYGAQDQRGTLNEVTPQRTAQALRLVSRAGQVKAYQLGEERFNGFPAFPSSPPREHEMRLLVFGWAVAEGFTTDVRDAYDNRKGIQSGTEPLGPNAVVGIEERFKENCNQSGSGGG
jgi:hypothetical protein